MTSGRIMSKCCLGLLQQAPSLACCNCNCASVPPLGGHFIWIIGRICRTATDWRLRIIYNQAQLNWRHFASAEPPGDCRCNTCNPSKSLPHSCT
ncbi:hypothetical protein F5Y14DRAFT_425794 [Nemania sp. NC0429]|nr:hypothetical protein F5Y14DRAFT_425794 [Nemania sp. NC0429]